MKSNLVYGNDNNVYRRGVNLNLMGMNNEFSNMNSNTDNNNLLTEQTFQKYDVIHNVGLKSSFINKPYKLVLYKNVTNDTSDEKVFVLNETLKDVVSVKFSQDDDRRLTTSGTGHIRFWKMAFKSFTYDG